MMEPRLQQVDDFLNNAHFVRWVLESAPADEQWWADWLAAHPESKEAAAEARLILSSLKIKEQTLEPLVLQQHIESIQDKATVQRRPAVIQLLRRWQYAAVLIPVLALALYFVFRTSRQPGNVEQAFFTAQALKPAQQQAFGLIETVNEDSVPRKIALADGSTVLLQPAARIRYLQHFDSGRTRDVFLSGEAFFDVAKNPGRPFRVYSQELVTKVLGTSFTVKADPAQKIFSVIVRTGKVSVTKRKSGEGLQKNTSTQLSGVLLTPNQELRYLRQEGQFQKLLIEYPVALSTAKAPPNFIYDDVPVSKVLAELQSQYGIRVLYDSTALAGTRINADLSTESIYKKLELICKALDARFQVVDGEVIIEAEKH